MPDFAPMTPQELDAVQYSSNPDDRRWLATVRDREARLLRAVELIVLARDNADDDLENRPARHSVGSLYARCSAWLAENADLLKGGSP